jgi:hypothetical protein
MALRFDAMFRFPLTTAAVLAGLILSGCAASPWETRRPVTALLSRPTPTSGTASTTPAATPNQQEPQRMQEVMAELQQLGTTDPAAHDKLLEDLRQSDPSLWPLVLQQFKATAAYRRRAMERTGATGPAAAVQRAERLPTTNDVSIASVETPLSVYAQGAEASQEIQPSASPSTNQVVQASYTAPLTMAGQQRLEAAIETLEAEIPKNPTTPAEVAQHARLRLLYAAAGRREDALRPIPAAPPAAQEFLAKELDGLSTWLSADQSLDTASRAAETKPALVEALGKLAESAPLVVRNMAFCTEVQSYGCAKRFEKYEFQSNQEVLLYAEVENFATELTPKGYHTSLRSTYQILDSRGQRVAEHAFAATEEHCQNIRRDYFIGYHLRLPKRLDPGAYTLQLSIEDLKCLKVGQASIEFVVKEGEAEKKDTVTEASKTRRDGGKK